MAYKRTRKDFESDSRKQETFFVVYGTPLPPLDEHARDDGSYVPVWKQEVTDDRGRKRLHGAFTGGFSAGYFNTVGSKEGWTPSTFISSRANRAKDVRNTVQQRPEDFMDEEDVREHEESQQLSTDRGFEGFGTADDANHRDALTDLLTPSETTIGEKLLGRMGWKQGQGIGPKVRRRIKPLDETSTTHLFAPDDTQMISLIKKIDHKGLNFDGDDKLDISINRPRKSPQLRDSTEPDGDDEEGPSLSFVVRNKKTSQLQRGAFGVGILNDTGSDDEDLYSVGPKISYNKTLGSEKRSKRSTLSKHTANPLLKNKPIFVPKKFSSLSDTLRRCHDGRLPLDGFVLADGLDNFSTLFLNDEKYKPPPVPDDWQPSQASSKDLAAEQSQYKSTSEAAKSTTLNRSHRGTILGESVLPGKSVFDYLTPSSREKLMKASGKVNLPPALGESLPGALSTPTSWPDDTQVPQIGSRTALQALSRSLNGGFTPYASDPAKAARYKVYLESQADSSTSTVTPLTRPPTMSHADYLTELHEFARAAEVFKPVSGLMASRFATSGTTGDTQSSDLADTNPESLLSRSTSKRKDPTEEAARMGMFGHLTRSVANFYPTRLLCKRFGVDMPVHGEAPPDPETAGVSADMDAQTATLRASLDQGRLASAGFQPSEKTDGFSMHARTNDQQPSIQTTGVNVAQAQPDTILQIAVVVVDPERNEALEQAKPGAAVFKAIFGSDDDEDD